MFLKICIALFLCCQIFIGELKAQTLNSNRSYPQDKSKFREHPVDFTHMDLDVSFIPDSGIVIGKVTHYFMPLQEDLDSIFLDAPKIQIMEVMQGIESINFTTRPDGVVIWLENCKVGKEYSITLTYRAKPSRGIYFMGWNHPEDRSNTGEWGHTRPQIWTQGQGVDNRHWIPCYDGTNDKITTSIAVHFPVGYQILSNGVLTSKSEKNGQSVWKYNMSKPHSPYLIMLAIGNYLTKFTASSRKVPIQFWFYPEFKNRLETTSKYTERMVDFMEKELNFNYPWEQYSQVMVQNFLYGAMENTTATIFGDFFAIDANTFPEYNYVSVNMHEFTHQWFGDFVTARHAPHHWLQESFATHYPKYFEREVFGEDHFNWSRLKEQQSCLDASKKDLNPVAHSEGGTARVYAKGSQVLDMMRYVLGNEAFRRVITHYLKAHPYGNVETNDLHQAVQDATGRNLDWFFDQWLYRGGEPKYQIDWSAITEKNQALTQINVRQIHDVSDIVGYFKMPIWAHVHYSDGTVDSLQTRVEGQQTAIKVPNPKNKGISFVVFDPNARVLKSMIFPRSTQELTMQLDRGLYMADRFEALMAFREVEMKEKYAVLVKAFQKENFWAMRVEILNQIPKKDIGMYRDLITKGIQDAHPKVRQTALQLLPEQAGAEWKEELMGAMKDSSYETRIIALKKAAFKQQKEVWREFEKVAAPLKWGRAIGNADKITYYQIWASVEDEGFWQAYDTLIRLASPRFEFRTRNKAFTALKELNYFDERVLEQLADAMGSWNGRLSGPAFEVAQYFLSVYENREITRKWLVKHPEKSKYFDGMLAK